MSDIIIEMTPFIFEDGNTYYFQILKRSSTNDYHDLFVYKKVIVKKRNIFFRIKEIEEFVLVSDKPELLNTSLDTYEIKRDIKKILLANKAKHQLKHWDGFVGDIPEDVKKTLRRDTKLKDILG